MTPSMRLKKEPWLINGRAPMVRLLQNNLSIELLFLIPFITDMQLMTIMAKDTHQSPWRRGTKWWPNCIFSFLVAVTEVNAKLIMDYFAQDPSKKNSQCSLFDET